MSPSLALTFAPYVDRVGGRFTPPVLSHHRTYGSVSGGLSNLDIKASSRGNDTPFLRRILH
jgi:hypothetical protein